MTTKKDTLEPLVFSEDLRIKMEKSMHLINRLTLENNKQIRDFRKKSQSMHPDLQHLATIMSSQLTVLEEKYKLLYCLTEDLYTRIGELRVP